MKYVFLVSEATSKNQLWLYKDIENKPNIRFIAPWGSSNIITKALRMVIMKIGRLFHTDIVKEINSRRFRIKSNENYCVVIEQGFLTVCKRGFFSDLRKHKNVKIYLLLVDSISAHSHSLQSTKNQIFDNDWDEIFTFEKDDADKYGWNYSGVNCSSLPRSKKTKAICDLYFVGGLKGNRSKLLFPVYNRLAKNGIRCKYDLWYQSRSERTDSKKNIDELSNDLKEAGIKDSGSIAVRKHFIKYKKVTGIVQSSNVIFEIVQEGQSAQTMRWFEAIYYNKKLLTNNPNIKNLPFYDERYMKYITCADDIDISWVLDKETIDYKYNGEMSPVRLLEKIRSKAEPNS